MNSLRRFILFVLLGLTLGSCRYYNQNRMLRTDNFYPYSVFDTTAVIKNYRLTPGDWIQFNVTSNRGSVYVSGLTNRIQENNNFMAKVEEDGFVKLPSVGRVYLQGLTFRQAELMLEDEYSKYINDPFVTLQFSNKRVFLFIGGLASVVQLKYDNTTLFEVLASSGGLPENAKAYKVKIIRGNLSDPKVYIVDLSQLKGLKNADLVMQGNDIIYIETRRNIAGQTLQQITPWVSILSTLLLTFTLIKTLTK